MAKLRIKNIEKVRALHYLNGYDITYETKSGREAHWELASRAGLERLKDEIENGTHYTDGTMIFACDEKREKVVLIKEYRVSAGRYLYTLPAGLSDVGESEEETAIREFKEETGMELSPGYVAPSRYVSVGIVNECVNVVYGFYSGTPSSAFLEDNEDAEVVIVDREHVKELLETAEVPFRTAALLENFYNLNPFINK